MKLSSLLLMLLVACPGLAAEVEPIAVTADRTEFVVTMSDSRELRSRNLAGATLTVAMDGGLMRVRIDAVELDPEAAKGQIWLHTLSTQAADGSWQSLCDAAPDGRRQAFPIAGQARARDGALVSADAGVFELTCTSGARGKCVRFGYLPWDGGAAGLALYNSCVRMVRADYCGQGEGTTRDGMLIDIYDDLGIQKADDLAEAQFEAGWTESGAVCVNHVRVKENTSFDRLIAACPHLKDRVGAMCTEDAARALGAKLFNRSRP